MPSLFVFWVVLWLGVIGTISSQATTRNGVPRWQWAAFGCCGVALGFHVIYCLILYPKYFTPFRHLPTPAARNTFTGNETGFFKETRWAVARRVAETVPNDGLFRYYVAFNQERLLVTSPKALAEILVQRNDDYDHPPLSKFSAMRMTGNGLQFSRGEEHKTQRKHLMPAFSPAHVKKLLPMFWSQTVKMVHGIEAELRKSPYQQPIFLTNWAIRAALDIIGIAGLGYEFDSLSNPENEHKQLTELYREMMSRSSPAFPWIGLLINYIDPRILLYLPERQNMALSKAFRNVRESAKKIIAARKENLQLKGDLDNGVDIITVALRSGMFSPEVLLDHVMTSLAVGHISTSIIFDWVIYELGQRPDMQARLREEIRSKLPGRMENVDASIIDTLPYLNAVCNEALRFYPPNPIQFRIAVRDTSILGTRVPKGTTVGYSAWVTNHDKDLWGSDADVFNPERWMAPGSGASGGATTNFAFMTFGAGPKNCIGQWWERMEFACLVAATVGKFEIELVNRDTARFVEPVVAMMSREGIYARLRVVDGW